MAKTSHITNRKLLKFFRGTGPMNTLTSREARARFGIKNLRARIAELRAEGNPVYTNYRTLSTGRRTAYYKLGRPSKTTRFAKYMRAGKRNLAIRSLYRRS